MLVEVGGRMGNWRVASKRHQLLHPHQPWAEINPPLTSPGETEGSHRVAHTKRSITLLSVCQISIADSSALKAVIDGSSRSDHTTTTSPALDWGRTAHLKCGEEINVF